MVLSVEDHYPSSIISSCFSFITIIINLITIILIRKKLHLHTVNHLLICNSSIATSLFAIVTINNYIYLTIIRWDTSNISCRFRAYFQFVGIAGILYSYMIHAISRLFFSIFSAKYRSLVSFKCHYILIIIQWFIVFLLTLPVLITDNVRYKINALCWISPEYKLHVAYTFLAYYILPVLITTIIYTWIYSSVKRTKSNQTIIVMQLNTSRKRDLEILRNIIILISIFIMGGLPSIASNVFPGPFIYLFSLTTMPLAVLLMGLCSILLDRELRNIFKSFIHRTTTQVTPITNTRS